MLRSAGTQYNLEKYVSSLFTLLLQGLYDVLELLSRCQYAVTCALTSGTFEVCTHVAHGRVLVDLRLQAFEDGRINHTRWSRHFAQLSLLRKSGTVVVKRRVRLKVSLGEQTKPRLKQQVHIGGTTPHCQRKQNGGRTFVLLFKKVLWKHLAMWHLEQTQLF